MQRFYVSERLSDNISETPEGFLVCHAVPITRTGELLYGPEELDLDIKENRPVRVIRYADDIFNEYTIASFEGKPVTINHPSEFVNPSNWKDLTVGIVQNVRQGDGENDDKLVCDLLITDAKAIEMVMDGLREMSCGYESDLTEDDSADLRQINIRGNHVALVKQGRAGPECRINDSIGDNIMSIKDKVASIFARARDEAMSEIEKGEGAEEKKVADEPMNSGQESDPVAAFEARLARLEEVITKIVSAKEEVADKKVSGDEDVPAKEEEKSQDADSGAMCKDADTISRAEILAPGIEKSLDVKEKALRAAYETADGKAVLHKLTGGQKPIFDSKDVVSTLFVAASELMKEARQKDFVSNVRMADTSLRDGAMTPAKLNELHAARWAAK